jgi:release factor glutamine methyltransferase
LDTTTHKLRDNPTLKTLWQATVRVLKEAALDTPVADARLLVQHAFDISHEQLLMHGDRVATGDEQARLQAVIDRRLKREPVSRIVGTRAFWKGEFIVTPDTLDPRQDSETVIEAVLTHARDPQRILDCGTGTGCLIVSLLGEYPQATGVAIDISAAAVDVARRNASAVADRIEFFTGDWVDYRAGAPFDVVVSNPPYIGLSEKKDLAPEVVDYDPHLALFAGDDGLSAYRSLVSVLPAFLADGGLVVLEIGHRQAGAVKDILAQGGFDVLETRRDLGGNDRVIVAKKP